MKQEGGSASGYPGPQQSARVKEKETRERESQGVARRREPKMKQEGASASGYPGYQQSAGEEGKETKERESQEIARGRETKLKQERESTSGYPGSQQSARVKEKEAGEGESPGAQWKMNFFFERQVWGPIGRRGAIRPCRRFQGRGVTVHPDQRIGAVIRGVWGDHNAAGGRE